MTSRFTWLSFIVVIAIGVSPSVMAQSSTKVVYLRGMFRDGKRLFFAVESPDLKTIRRFELNGTAKISLLFPKPPFGRYVHRNVTTRRFADVFSGKDRKEPQPLTLKSLFQASFRAAKITSLTQLNR